MARTSVAPETKKLSARDRLLAASDELFYNEGIHTVGIDLVIEKAGVAKGSLYYIFGGKDQLVETYLYNRHQAWMEVVQRGMDAADDPRAKILAVFDELGTLFAASGFRGCAFVNATAEALPGSPEDLAATKLRGWIHELFFSLASAAGAVSPRVLADQLVVRGADGARLDVVRVIRSPSLSRPSSKVASCTRGFSSTPSATTTRVFWSTVPRMREPASSEMVSLVTPLIMASPHRILSTMRDQPQNVAFADLAKICRAYFGEPRQSGTSHMVFRTPWHGDPRVNIQNDHGKAKQYQVRQVLKAIDRLESEES